LQPAGLEAQYRGVKAIRAVAGELRYEQYSEFRIKR
jgi:hypothetical protein